MNRLITRYILRLLFLSAGFVTLVLVGGVWLTQSLRFVKLFIYKDVSFVRFMGIASLLIPDLLSIVLPACILISVLFAYHKLSTDHHLVVLRSFGMNSIQLAKPALLFGGFGTIVVLILNIFIVPHAFQTFRNQEHKIRHALSASFLQERVFNTMKGMTIYVRENKGGNRLRGVFIYSNGSFRKDSFGLSSNRKKPYTILAEEGQVESTSDGYRLVLKDGRRQERDPLTGHLSFFYFKTFSYDLSYLTRHAKPRVIKPVEMTITQLLTQSPKGEDTHLIARLRAQGHQRILTPFLAFAFSIFGALALLRRAFSRQDQIKRLVQVVVGAIGGYASVITLLNMNTKVWAVPLAYMLVFSLSGIGLGLLNPFTPKEGRLTV